MNTTKLGLGIIAAIALTTLVAPVPGAHAQEVETPTEQTELRGEKGGRLGKLVGKVKKGMKGHHRTVWDHLESAGEYFEDLTDAEEDLMKGEIEAYQETRPTHEEMESLSEEDRKATMDTHKDGMQEIIEKYVDDGELADYQSFVENQRAEYEAKKEEKKLERQEKRTEKQQQIMDKFLNYIEDMTQDEKNVLVERIANKAETIQTRIEESDLSDERKENALEMVNGFLKELLEALV